MMTEAPMRIRPGEASVDEIIDRLQAGQRVIVERELLGGVHEITLRFDGEIYYCDTPTTLHRHETADGMRQCLKGQRYAEE
jgi:hemin uptake protein HemP